MNETETSRGWPEYYISDTPAEAAERMVALADINPGQSILEPGAGRGALLEAIRRRHPAHLMIPFSTIDVCEFNETMAFELKRKGERLVSRDCLQLLNVGRYGVVRYDRILMNPPFERDMELIRSMFTLLKEGGKLVALTYAHWIYGLDDAQENFRQFVKLHGGYEEITLETHKGKITPVILWLKK